MVMMVRDSQETSVVFGTEEKGQVWSVRIGQGAGQTQEKGFGLEDV